MATSNLDALLKRCREQHAQNLARECQEELKRNTTMVESLYGALHPAPTPRYAGMPFPLELPELLERASLDDARSIPPTAMSLDTIGDGADDIPDRSAAEAENRAFRDRLLGDATWVAAHQGEWVAVSARHVVGTSVDAVTLQYEVTKRLPRTPWLIFGVGVSLDPVAGPAPTIAQNDDNSTAR